MIIIQELMKIDKDVEGAIEMCQLAINSSHADPKMELYFRIAKTLVTYQLMHEEPDISDVTRIGSMIKVMENSTTSDKAHLECIKDFYVCTKLAYMFYEGKSRTSRQLLRQIQKSQTSGETKIHGIRYMNFVPNKIIKKMLLKNLKNNSNFSLKHNFCINEKKLFNLLFFAFFGTKISKNFVNLKRYFEKR